MDELNGLGLMLLDEDAVSGLGGYIKKADAEIKQANYDIHKVTDVLMTYAIKNPFRKAWDTEYQG